PSRTDFTAYEKFTSGLNKDHGIGAYLCLIGLYAELQPLKSVPFIINGQWYNDWTIYDKLMSKYEPARKHIKGNGGSLGIKYIF
ncbi:MAG TPA: hypothetical protein VGO09_09235, partial [Flavisolibacter sp.]|nr:hypothetical protein [Flavisolibacter sp.]